MNRKNTFIAYLLEHLEPLGPVRARKMFGGYGLFLNDRMFGLVSKDAFYLKVDHRNRPDFEAAGSEPFSYERAGKPYSMSYFLVPPEVLEDTDTLCDWAKKAWEAALRAGSRA